MFFSAVCVAQGYHITFPRLASVASFGTDYFLLKIIFLAKRKREFTTKFAIAPNVCACCTTQIYKYLHKNEIICKFIHARKEEFYPTIICIG